MSFGNQGCELHASRMCAATIAMAVELAAPDVFGDAQLPEELMKVAVKRYLALALLPFLLLACSKSSDLVFVPGDDFSASLEIALQTEAVAGEWFNISAKRRSGPWKRVPLTAVPRGAIWFANQPQEIEPEVAENVSWVTDPEGAARFGTLPGSGWRPRTVMFAEPGTY